MEKLNLQVANPEHLPAGIEQTAPYADVSPYTDVKASIDSNDTLTPEGLNPATEEQISAILSSAHEMVSGLPTTRHTEQDELLDKVDVDEAILPDVTVRHIKGKDDDVTVIEPSSEQGSAQIVIDNKSQTVFIDGEPVDQLGADRVSGVIEVTRNMNTQGSVDDVNDAVNEDIDRSKPEDNQETSLELSQSDQPSNTDTEQKDLKALEQKRQLLGQVGQFMKTKNGDMAFKQLAAEMDVDLSGLRDRMSTGDINVDQDTMRALAELQREGAKPGSDIWQTDPRTGSMLGGVARESQQLLTNVLRNML